MAYTKVCVGVYHSLQVSRRDGEVEEWKSKEWEKRNGVTGCRRR